MYTQQDGWFSNVNGLPVIKQPVDNFTPNGWTYGHPIGYVFHLTDGYQADISGTLKSRGISVHFSVGRGGEIYQYVSVLNRAWHADYANGYYLGVEHTSHQPDAPLTDVELEASVKLTAALVEFVKDHWSYSIPLRKIDSWLLVAGFHDHKDGYPPHWNLNQHGDGLYQWTWDRYLGEVKAVLEGDDMTDAEKEQLRVTSEFVKGISAFMRNPDPSRTVKPEWSAERKSGFLFAKAALTEPKA
jgi:hypothetical protein